MKVFKTSGLYKLFWPGNLSLFVMLSITYDYDMMYYKLEMQELQLLDVGFFTFVVVLLCIERWQLCYS